MKYTLTVSILTWWAINIEIVWLINLMLYLLDHLKISSIISWLRSSRNFIIVINLKLINNIISVWPKCLASLLINLTVIASKILKLTTIFKNILISSLSLAMTISLLSIAKILSLILWILWMLSLFRPILPPNTKQLNLIRNLPWLFIQGYSLSSGSILALETQDFLIIHS